MTKAAASKKGRDLPAGDEAEVRARILDAAFAAFMDKGYASASTLEIATRARVSKRDLYALVGNKEKMLISCITNRARRFEMPAGLPEPRDIETLERILAAFGSQLLREISDPTVVGMFRLAIAEAVNSPEVAGAITSIGGKAVDAALHKLLADAKKSRLITGNVDELADQYWGLLWGDLQVSLLLGASERPNAREIGERSRNAAAAFLRLNSAR